MFYNHNVEDNIENQEILIVVGLLVGVWWGILHFLDWFMLDIIPWWMEPLLLFPVLILLFLVVEYGKNPLYWWPLCCGTRVSIPDETWFRMVYDSEKLIKKYGGPLNVFVAQEYIKFRRKRDAVTFCLVHL